ncbi:MAG: CoA-acylating methylmalonate-semialdehyde dehydrogenase [Gammaproteobacteria bacterium]|nr:CoA-acylating methylmalonate-semialdehyde dehydrogenase [Gammaproteobacteria bacterium]
MSDSHTVYDIPHFIDGHRSTGENPRWAEVYNPAEGTVAGRVALASQVEAEAAILAAHQAFRQWSETPILTRARLMFRFRELLDQHRTELARIVTREHGKVLSDAAGSIQRGFENVEYACGIAELLKGDYSPQVATGVDSYSMRLPLGVCAGITPFNFPVMVPLWMFPLAIACGNTFVLKPSEKDPSAALFLAELLHEAGAPPGVLNVLQGDRVAVDTLLTDPRVAAVSFVGSTPVAEHVYHTGTRHGKRVQALGGAKNHLVVLADADLDQAADALVNAAYGSAGERCMAISVGVVVDAIAEELVAKLKTRIGQLKIAAGTVAHADMGPLITREHQAKVMAYIDVGAREGAQLVIDGRGLKVAGATTGFFVGPTLFDHASPTMRIYREEIFGPVLTLIRVADLDAAITLVNAHEYGNGCAVFTREGGAAREFCRRAEIGMIGINVPIPVPMAFHSFGGWKRSLFGDTAIYGPEGVHFYTRLKTVTARWPLDTRPGVNLNFPS